MKKHFLILSVLFLAILSGCHTTKGYDVTPTELVARPKTITVDAQNPDFYSIDKNEEFILAFKMDNPKKLEIISVMINNELIPSYQFERNSTVDTIYIKFNSGDTPGTKKYELQRVKAIDGTRIVDLQATSNNTVELFVNYTVPTIEALSLDKGFYQRSEKATLTVTFLNPDNVPIEAVKVNEITYTGFKDVTSTSVKLTLPLLDQAGYQRFIVNSVMFKGQVIEYNQNNEIEAYVLKTDPAIEDINLNTPSEVINLGSTIVLSIEIDNVDFADIKSIEINHEPYIDFVEGTSPTQLLVNYQLNNDIVQTIKITGITFHNGVEEITYNFTGNMTLLILDLRLPNF